MISILFTLNGRLFGKCAGPISIYHCLGIERKKAPFGINIFLTVSFRVWVFNTIGICNTFKSVLGIGIFNTFEIFPQTEVLVLNTFIFQVPIPNTFVFLIT